MYVFVRGVVVEIEIMVVVEGLLHHLMSSNADKIFTVFASWLRVLKTFRF